MPTDSSFQIPEAHDGDVITAEYHNALRDALRRLAREPGQDGVAATTVTTLAALLPMAEMSAWTFVQPGIAEGSSTNTLGWMPLALPDGLRIQEFVVTGAQATGVESTAVSLQRRRLDGDGPPDRLFAGDLVQLVGHGGAFTVTIPALTGLDQHLRVATDTYGYFVQAEIQNGNGDSVFLRSFQVICGRG